jgi:spore maturation protein CgeB
MKILYLGPERGTALQRILALRRMGHEVTPLDSTKAMQNLILPFPLISACAVRTGALGLGGVFQRYVRSQVKGGCFDLVFVDHGPFLNPAAIGELRNAGGIVVNYNQDNPYVTRDGLKWRQFRRALPFYDLVVTPRASSVEPAKRAGARRVIAVNFAADEAVHRPIELTEEDRARYSAKVAFVGTWMPERGPFLLRLIERGVPLRIYGDRWKNAPEYERLRPHIASGDLAGDEYVKAIAGAAIAIGLLSKGNQDLHTTRSLEIPAIGTLFCAERTSDHLAMYKEGEEAVFFDSADECADLCLALLTQPDRIAKIAAAGAKRVRQNGDFNERLLGTIIAAALKP